MRVRTLFTGLFLCLFAGPGYGASWATPTEEPLWANSPQASMPASEKDRPKEFETGATYEVQGSGRIKTSQGSASLTTQKNNAMHLMVPDSTGGFVLVPGAERPTPSPAMIQAQELKLHIRELVAQLLEVWPGQPLTGMVALPTTFVALNNFQETSGLGRYLAESMFYEFNTRGFATREYRTNGVINMVPGQGEFTLSRALPDVKISKDWAALLVGTYYRDQDAVFINARLVRPSDGLVLRTGQIILPVNTLVARMTAQPRKPPFAGRVLPIVQGAKR